ncbi:hypothetical protein NQ129_25180, partial [Priestia aryabhattai]|uniref:hypothetical protein n=1 Tax=Priestia aryabhattai TaxID=412384 RepID=UPI00211C1B1D
RGLTCSAFPAGVFALPSNQLLEGTKQTTLICPNKKINHESNMLINGSFFTWVKILLSQPLGGKLF